MEQSKTCSKCKKEMKQPNTKKKTRSPKKVYLMKQNDKIVKVFTSKRKADLVNKENTHIIEVQTLE